MGLLKRKAAPAAASSTTKQQKEASVSPKQAKADKKQPKADKPSTELAAAATGGAASLRQRRALGALTLAIAIASAVSEWPIYLAYEKDWRRPALGFTMNFSITAVIALLVGCSPPIRALKPSSAATEPMPKNVKVKIITCIAINMMALAYGFGLYGPSGALTGACLIASVFLLLP